MQLNAPVVVHVKPPGFEVTVYPVIAEPPVVVGANQETVTCPFPRTPVTVLGTPGTVAGVTATEAVEASELPTAFVATTVKV